jgi:hypothetical protein
MVHIGPRCSTKVQPVFITRVRGVDRELPLSQRQALPLRHYPFQYNSQPYHSQSVFQLSKFTCIKDRVLRLQCAGAVKNTTGSPYLGNSLLRYKLERLGRSFITLGPCKSRIWREKELAW